MGSILLQAEAQTVVTISEKTPKLTAEDLKSPEVSEAYWRRVAERIHADIDRELVKNFTVCLGVFIICVPWEVESISRDLKIGFKIEDFITLKSGWPKWCNQWWSDKFVIRFLVVRSLCRIIRRDLRSGARKWIAERAYSSQNWLCR